MKKIFFLAVITFPVLTTAQSYYKDAIRFGNTLPLGSARIQALGGASVALGADPSAILSNPAGLGLYNSWEIALTPAIGIINTETSLNNSFVKNTDTKFLLNQLSIVFENPNKIETDLWLGGSWGFGVQKINDFNSEIVYNATNSKNSLIDFFIQKVDGSLTSSFPPVKDAFKLTFLAYHNYLINPWNTVNSTFSNKKYFSDVTSIFRPTIQQTETIKTSGSQHQISLGYGANIADVFYFGFNSALVMLNYKSLKNYAESKFDYTKYDPAYHPINSFSTTEELSINGTGWSFNFGVIIRPMPAFRIGASITTPTVYVLSDSYKTTMGVEWDNFQYENIIEGNKLLQSTSVKSAIIKSIYTLSTPVKFALGGAIFLKKRGFFTLDAEFVNYGKTKLESQQFSMDNENNYLAANFFNQVNLKTGVELRFSPLRLRVGYSINNVPTDKKNNLIFKNQAFSLGAGVLLNQLYTDFTLVYKDKKAQYSPYILTNNAEPIVNISVNIIEGVFTVGYKF